MTSTQLHPETHPAAPHPSLRLRLADGPQPGPLDGAWWPRSRDLAREVADLVDHFPHGPDSIVRLLFTRPDWDGQTPTHSDHTVRCARGSIKVGSFPHDDSHQMVVATRSQQHITLLVVPPETDPGTAELLMTRASDGRNALSATHLLAELLTHDPDPLAVWDSEGGRIWP